MYVIYVTFISMFHILQNKNLDGVFNTDQLAAIKKKPIKREPDLIIKEIKLRMGPGVHRYKYLLSSGNPAPCI